MRGMRKGRADLLPTAAVIVLALSESLELDEFVVSDWGSGRACCSRQPSQFCDRTMELEALV